jgi:ATP-dependent RNA helicase DeaD
VHVVVGTPGGSSTTWSAHLDLSELTTLVLDEADEMLRMGFIDDVETVLKKTRRRARSRCSRRPCLRRSAASPRPTCASRGKSPSAAKTTTAANIRQRFWYGQRHAQAGCADPHPGSRTVRGDDLFARTKRHRRTGGKLQARGWRPPAINGDIQQAQREKTIQQLKDGKIDVLVATDVAARGLDVERISHVLNYDIPYDTESYVHRIGRTGRAGRNGDAILFVTPRERRHAAFDRARHPPADRGNEAAQCGGRQRPPRGEIPQPNHRHPGRGQAGDYRSLVEGYDRHTTGRWSTSPPRWRDWSRAIHRCCCRRTVAHVPQAFDTPRHERPEAACVRAAAERPSHGTPFGREERPQRRDAPATFDRDARPARREAPAAFERSAPSERAPQGFRKVRARNPAHRASCIRPARL